MPDRFRALNRLGLVLTGVIVALATMEVIVRQAESQGEYAQHFADATAQNPDRWVSHPFLPFAGNPNRESVFRNSGERGEPLIEHVQTNSYGYRSHEFPKVKRPEDYFVVALGGSTTYGVAASNQQTWPEVLERMLGEKYPERNVRVFNLGMQRGTTAYSLVSLALIGIRLHPDLIIVYHGCNDMAAMGAANYRPDHAHFYADLRPETIWRGVLRNLPRWALRSHAVVFIANRLDEILEVNALARAIDLPRQAAVDPLEGFPSILENLQTIEAIGHGANASVLFSTFKFADVRNRALATFNDGLRAFFQENAMSFVDQDRLLVGGERSLQIDLCHFTQLGRDQMARNYYDEIVRRGLIASAPPDRKAYRLNL